MLATFAVIAFSAVIHASFQLSVSVLTLLSGHAIGSKTAHGRLMHLVTSFITGAGIMTLLLLSFGVLAFQPGYIPASPFIWSIACGIVMGLGIAVWAFYYRREAGTSLWLPRGMARFLSDRTKATKQGAEAFSLGIASVLAEILFIMGPLFVASLAISTLPPIYQAAGMITYLAISLLSLLAVAGLVGGGHKLSHIQRWREANKRFLQFAAGSGLLVLGLYVYVEQVMTASVLGHGGF
jgi:uncharacterized membrane protein (DUF485 family)